MNSKIFLNSTSYIDFEVPETTGFDVTHNGIEINIKGTMSFVSAVNLATNAPEGFVFSFNKNLSE
jgi:hypothetical protein